MKYKELAIHCFILGAIFLIPVLYLLHFLFASGLVLPSSEFLTLVFINVGIGVVFLAAGIISLAVGKEKK